MPNEIETRTITVTAHAVSLRRFKLAVVGGPDRGREHTSTGGEVSVGTGEGNQLQLSDRAASRHHCVVIVTEKGFLLRDLESTNGTWVAGMRVREVYLPAGASLTLGETTLRFEALDEEVEEPLSGDDRWEKLLGRSALMRKLFALVPKLASSDATLLIEGETGTGKSVLAEAIHRASPRAAKPWVVVDCSTIPPTLVESVLFGHEKGAFTGATSARAGAFEAANGGTVLLDEVGELPSEMQPKLLRLLETKTVTRIGRVDPIALDVRILAATHRDLREMVNRGTFRSDLFYRLNVVKLRMPSLRERREDIAMLCAHFFAEATGGTQRPSAEQLVAFVNRDWPGNIRELRHAVENAVLIDELGSLADDAPSDQSAVFETRAAFDPALPFREAKEQITQLWERWYLQELVRRTGGNLSRASREAQMDRRYLRDLLRKHAVR